MVKVLQTLYKVKNDEVPAPVRSYPTWKNEISKNKKNKNFNFNLKSLTSHLGEYEIEY